MVKNTTKMIDNDDNNWQIQRRKRHGKRERKNARKGLEATSDAALPLVISVFRSARVVFNVVPLSMPNRSKDNKEKDNREIHSHG